MRIFRILIACLLVLVGVVSTIGSYNTGGGSGGASGFKPFVLGTGPQPDLDITSTNAQEVAATVVWDIEHQDDVLTIIGGQIYPGPPATPELLPGYSRFELFVAEETAPGYPIDSLTEACAVSGTVTVLRGLYNDNFNDVNALTVSEGDIFDLVFDSCDDGDGYNLDGSFTVEIMMLEGDLQTDVFRLEYRLSDMSLMITDSMNSYVASVLSMRRISWDSLDFPEVMLAGGIPFITYQADDYSSYGSHYLTVNADLSIPETLAAGYATLLESTALGGNVSYEITVPLQTPDRQAPESGEILISGGEGNGTIHIVIESGSSVRLEIDADDDGTIEDYQYTTWATLQS